MRKKHICRNIVLGSCAVMMVLSAGIGEAWAYFTTYTRAAGGYVIEMPPDTEIKEKFTDWTKVVTISNKEDCLPVYIRVKAFCGGEFDLVYSDLGGKWSLKSDGYWYYSDIVYGGSETEPMSIRIEKIPEDVEESDEFNVVVIYESTLVRYDKDGKPYMNWSAKQDSGRVEGGRWE